MDSIFVVVMYVGEHEDKLACNILATPDSEIAIACIEERKKQDVEYNQILNKARDFEREWRKNNPHPPGESDMKAWNEREARYEDALVAFLSSINVPEPRRFCGYHQERQRSYIFETVPYKE